MTEKKRFKYYEESNGEFPFPYIKNTDGKSIISLYECCDLLNEQHETIHDQKRQLDELDGLLNKFEVTFEELEDILYMNRSRL